MSALTMAAVVAVAGSPLLAAGCKATGVGDPCVPEQEYEPTFNGFNAQEVNLESKSFQCQTRLCLVNHFQGRVSCAYGQSIDGKSPGDKDTSGKPVVCAIPGTNGQTPITGKPADPNNPIKNPQCKQGETDKQCVLPQCTDRKANDAVYCSCRCANIDGKTDDGANYCTCPDGFSCAQLVTSIGANDNPVLTGGYCIRNGTDYKPGQSCTGASNCDPADPKKQCAQL